MRRTFFILIVLVVSSVAIKADDFSITTGHVTLQNFGAERFFVFIDGPNISMSGEGLAIQFSSPIDFCSACLQGSLLNLGAHVNPLSSLDWNTGSLIVNGVPHSLPWPSNISGRIDLDAGSVTLPFSSDPSITVSAPFSMTAGFSDHLTFSATFSGQGIVSVVLQTGSLSGHPAYLVNRVTYEFSYRHPNQLP